MKRAALLGSIAIAVLYGSTAHASFTVPDAVFWGSVEIEGTDAPAGTVVSGRVAGTELTFNHVLGSDPDDPNRYTLHVPMSHPDSFFAAPLPGTAFPGSSIRLYVAESFVVEIVLEAGEITRVDLNDTGSPPPTFTATPLRPTPTVTPTRPVGVATRTRTPTRNPTPGGPTPTMTRVVTGSPSATPSGSTTPSPSPTPTPDGEPSPTPDGGPMCDVPCTGDCNGNCRVTINELIVLVDISLSEGTVDTCLAGDPNGDERITINELVTAVARALNGCPLTPSN